MKELPKGLDVNQLSATGSAFQINILLIKMMEQFKDEEFGVSSLVHSMVTNPTSTLELSFTSKGGFSEEIFLWITSSILVTDGLFIRVMCDELASEYNKEYTFKDGRWNFESIFKDKRIDLTKKSPRPTLTRYPGDKTIYTNGAYIERISYINQQGKRTFGWIVNGFTEETFCDGLPLDVVDSATFLQGLTPPEPEKLTDEYIIQALQSHGLVRVQLGYYRTRFEDDNTFIYVYRLEDIDNMGKLEPIVNTLDEFLLRSPLFCNTTREILTDAFGRDFPSIFLSENDVLVIQVGENNYWTVKERRENNK